MGRTRVRTGRIAALIAAISVTVVLISGAASGRIEAPAGGSGGDVHVVAQGDTLWGIARDLVGPEGDPRPLVQDLRDLNGLGPSDVLMPGLPLALPAP
ncbi:MAG TPA: LysM domain-containing protein [Actinomycetota bacterium]